jgi:hypothetical protein
LIFHPGKVSNFCWFWQEFPNLELHTFCCQSEQALKSGKLFPETFTGIYLPIKPFPGREPFPATFPGQRFLCSGNISRQDIFLPKISFQARGFSPQETFPGQCFLCL